MFLKGLGNKVFEYHLNVTRTWAIRHFLLVGPWITTS